jgi:hypothetical protein
MSPQASDERQAEPLNERLWPNALQNGEEFPISEFGT